ncbi:MAG TPA: hypothetical protein VLL25_10935, partial [Acidimicrobiales bacterium]|nr:hypothetical protein [Acidimicrobiales bacterium]
MNARWFAATALLLVVSACSDSGTRSRLATARTAPTRAARTTATDPTTQPLPSSSATTTTSTTIATTTTTRVAPTIPTTTTAPQTPYPVATTTVGLVDSTRPTVSLGRTLASFRTLTTLVWYPNVAGRWPLIVFAHGFKVGPVPYTRLCQTWAAAGYVVA